MQVSEDPLGNWDDLRTFLALVRQGTLAAAGADLGVNQSTVFRRLESLESRLAVRLLERRGRGYVLTPAGEELAVLAARVEEDVLAIGRKLGGRDTELRGTVRLTTSDTLFQGLLAGHLAEFRRRAPGVHLEVLVDDRYYMLGRGEADVAVRAGSRPSEPDVIPRQVGTCAGAFYASEGYLAERGVPRRRDALAAHDIVSLDRNLAHVPFARHTEALVPAQSIVCRCTAMHAMAAAVEAGMGIGALPCFLMDGRPGLRRVFAPEPELASPLWVILHRDLRSSARVRTFADFLEEALSSESARLEGGA